MLGGKGEVEEKGFNCKDKHISRNRFTLSTTSLKENVKKQVSVDEYPAGEVFIESFDSEDEFSFVFDELKG